MFSTDKLKKILGENLVLSDDQICETYSRDQSFVSGKKPDAVVFAESAEQVQEVLRYANKTKTPVVPRSSGLNLHGAAVPAYGGIVLDLSKMDRIIEINEKDLYVIVEPGVTFKKLQNTLIEKSLRIMVPFGIPPERSVLTSYLERDIVMTSASTEYGNFLTHDTELILPDGELFRTGCWNLGGRPGGLYGPGLNTIHRLWTGAQGTLGVFTKMVISIHHLSPVRNFFFIPFENINDIPEPIKKIQRKELGWECFGLNRFNLAAILNDDWQTPETFPAKAVPSSNFEKLKASLPPWTVIIGISGLPHLPEEWIKIQEEVLFGICGKEGLKVGKSLPGFPDIENVFLKESLKPFSILKKFNYKGAIHDLSFKTQLNKIPEMERTLISSTRYNGSTTDDIGGYFSVIERGRSVHCEFDLHATHGPSEQKEKVKTLWETAGRDLLDAGALFDQPYGYWAEIVYARAPQYHKKLKQLKSEMDPQGILNPGRLCFTTGPNQNSQFKSDHNG